MCGGSQLTCIAAVLTWWLSHLELIVNQARHYLQYYSERYKEKKKTTRYLLIFVIKML